MLRKWNNYDYRVLVVSVHNEVCSMWELQRICQKERVESTREKGDPDPVHKLRPKSGQNLDYRANASQPAQTQEDEQSRGAPQKTGFVVKSKMIPH